MKGYISPFTGIDSCKYYKTDLCSLTGNGCHADIQCYKEEIIDTNKHNGNPDPNANVDRAIRDESERTFMVGVYLMKNFFFNFYKFFHLINNSFLFDFFFQSFKYYCQLININYIILILLLKLKYLPINNNIYKIICNCKIIVIKYVYKIKKIKNKNKIKKKK